MKMEKGTSNINSNLINAKRGLKCCAGDNTEGVGEWHTKEGIHFSMQHLFDIFAVVEGRARPIEETDHAQEPRRKKLPLVMPGVCPSSGTLLQCQAAFDRSKQGPPAIIH